MHPDKVAEELLKGMQKRKFMIIPGFEGKLTYHAKRFTPGIVNYFMERDIRKTSKKQ